MRNRKVYLSGNVDSPFQRSRAAEVAARISGVAAIENNLTHSIVQERNNNRRR